MNRAMRRLQHRCRSRWFSVLGGPDGVEFDVTRETMSSLASPSIVYERPGAYAPLRSESGLDDLREGPNFAKNGEIFSWLDPSPPQPPRMQRHYALGHLTHHGEAQGAVCAAAFMQTRYGYAQLPTVITRSYQVAQSKMPPEDQALFLRSHVQHFFAGSRNVTVFTELVIPKSELGPLPCMRLVSNYLVLKDGEQATDFLQAGKHFAFHSELRSAKPEAQSPRNW
ncbi:hypothetical protein DIPPA_30275 [Diplonema papillatum]|nr:hypothetical protein DIPPA_30275 [Diplonema papillatum]